MKNLHKLLNQPMKRQKRYESEQEIIGAIDHQNTRRASLSARAASLEAKKLTEGLSYPEQDELCRCDKACRRIEDVILPKLKRTLAAFSTEVLPITQDRGVIAE